MSHHARMLGVVVIGVLLLMLGITGVADGGLSAHPGWWIVAVGILLIGFAWRDLNGRHRRAE